MCLNTRQPTVSLMRKIRFFLHNRICHLVLRVVKIIRKLYYCDVLGVLETSFGLLIRFITTSLVVTTITIVLLQCALFTSVLILYLGWSSDCWLLGCCSNLLLWSHDVASLIDSFDLPFFLVCSFDLLLMLHLWSVPLLSLILRLLICSWRCLSDRLLWSAPDVASLIGSFIEKLVLHSD
jgi:hypothetical protein